MIVCIMLASGSGMAAPLPDPFEDMPSLPEVTPPDVFGALGPALDVVRPVLRQVLEAVPPAPGVPVNVLAGLANPARCGILEVRVASPVPVGPPVVTQGLNCGNVGVALSVTCGPLENGGRECTKTYNAFGSAVRWINEGSFQARIVGECQDEADESWDGVGAFAPVAATVECSVAQFLPSGTCISYDARLVVEFDGVDPTPAIEQGFPEVPFCV